jgi:hypothetical protein
MIALTVVTGVVDAVGFRGLDRVFTGNMTGNIVILGMGVAGADELPVLGSRGGAGRIHRWRQIGLPVSPQTRSQIDAATSQSSCRSAATPRSGLNTRSVAPASR